MEGSKPLNTGDCILFALIADDMGTEPGIALGNLPLSHPYEVEKKGPENSTSRSEVDVVDDSNMYGPFVCLYNRRGAGTLMARRETI